MQITSMTNVITLYWAGQSVFSVSASPLALGDAIFALAIGFLPFPVSIALRKSIVS